MSHEFNVETDVVVKDVESFFDLENFDYFPEKEPLRAVIDCLKYAYYSGLICCDDCAYLITDVKLMYACDEDIRIDSDDDCFCYEDSFFNHKPPKIGD